MPGDVTSVGIDMWTMKVNFTSSIPLIGNYDSVSSDFKAANSRGESNLRYIYSSSPAKTEFLLVYDRMRSLQLFQINDLREETFFSDYYVINLIEVDRLNSSIISTSNLEDTAISSIYLIVSRYQIGELVAPLCILKYSFFSRQELTESNNLDFIYMTLINKTCDYERTAYGATIDKTNKRLFLAREHLTASPDSRLQWSMFYFHEGNFTFDAKETVANTYVRATSMVGGKSPIKLTLFNDNSFMTFRGRDHDNKNNIIVTITTDLQVDIPYLTYEGLADSFTKFNLLSPISNSTFHILTTSSPFLSHDCYRFSEVTYSLSNPKYGDGLQIQYGFEQLVNIGTLKSVFIFENQIYIAGTSVGLYWTILDRFNGTKLLDLQRSQFNYTTETGELVPPGNVIAVFYSMKRQTAYAIQYSERVNTTTSLWTASFHSITSWKFIGYIGTRPYRTASFVGFRDGKREQEAVIQMTLLIDPELWIVDLNTASVKSIGGANGRVLESFVFNNYAFFVGTTPQVTSFNLKTFERRTFKYEVLEGIQVTSCHLDDQQEYLYIVTEKSIIQFDLKQLEFMNHYLTPVGLTSASIFNQGFGLVSGGEQSLVIFSVPKRDISPGMNRLVVPLVVSGISVLLFLVALVILCCLIQARSVYKKRRALQSMKYQLLDLPSSEYNNIINSNGTYGSDKWILNIEDIKFKERINEGAGGIVFKAEWKNIRVAVKKMKRDHLDVDHASFIREAQLLIQLRHTNIVLFLGVCVSDDHTLIVTEFLDNGSLDGYLNGQFKLLSFREKLLILCQVVQAMIYLHSLKPSLIHRDLKPQNILLDRHMQAKICDFGLSKFDEGRGSMTGYIGTLNYMAPEVLGRNDKYTTSCDVYSFAMVMYQVLFEAIPFSLEDTNPYMLAVEVLRGRRPVLPWTLPQSPSTTTTEEARRMDQWCREHKYPLDQMQECVTLMNHCWVAEEDFRPNFEQIYSELEQIFNR